MKKVVYRNKRASFDYEILDQYEAGMELLGWEVKSAKAGHVSVDSGYIDVRGNEAFLINSKIPIWRSSIEKNIDLETRRRKLLLKRREILKLQATAKIKGNTLIPLEIYINPRGLLKLTLATVRGKKKFDKRSKIKEKDMKRAIEVDRKYYGI